MRIVAVFFFASLYTVCAASNCEDLGIFTHTKSLDGRVVQTLIADSEKTQIYILTSKNTVYKSSNGGQTFQNQMSYMPHSGSKQPGYNQSGIQKMFKTTLDGHVLFMGFGYQYWTTDGTDHSFTYYHDSEEPWANFIPNPQIGDAILGVRYSDSCLTFTNCFKSLYYSADWGATWKLLRSYVFETSWANNNSIYLISVPTDLQNGDQSAIRDGDKQLFRINVDAEVLFHSENGFYTFENMNGIIYAGRKINDTHELLISSDRCATFIPARFSDSVSDFPQETSAYTLLDNNGDVTFLHVNRANSIYYGSLYEANTADGEFWLTMRSNRISPGTHTIDFQQVLGLQGIYLANQYNISLLMNDSPANEQYVASMISRNKGGIWTKLPVPSNSLCSSPECSLHLEGLVDGKGILTDEQVVGMLLAVGNEGTEKESRSDNINLYMSRDAGATWERIQNGPRIFNWGNYGSLILSTSRVQATDNVTFSWNQGLSWDECTFSTTEIEVEQIIPLGTDSLEFFVIGSRSDDGDVSGYAVYVSFEGNATALCAGENAPDDIQSDFESWSTEWDGECLLGKVTTYTRRKRDSTCIVTTAPFSVASEVCECTREDYICDGLCYQQEIVNGTVSCVFQEGCTSLGAEECDGSTMQSHGYRLLVDDVCLGGVDLLPTNETCETSKNTGFNVTFASYVLLGVLICLIILSLVLLVLIFMLKKHKSLNDKISPFIPDWCTRDPSSSVSEKSDQIYSQLDQNQQNYSLEDLLD